MMRSISAALSEEIDFTILYAERDETPEHLSEILGPAVRSIPWHATASLHPGNDFRALQKLREVVAEVNPDVVHAFSSKAGALARIAHPTGRTPICYSPSGYSFLRVDVGAITRFAFYSIEKVLGRTRSLTVACGFGEYELARRMSRHAMVIPNFVAPPDDSAPMQKYSRTRPMRVVSVGRIAPQKNFPLFCEIADRMAGAEIEFQWVGGGDVPAGCRVPANVDVTGWIPHEHALEILSTADVYVQTSRYEGLPVTILEALARGRPVLATPVLGNAELIVEGENGSLCDTAEAFAHRLASLQQNEDEWAYLSRTAKLMSGDHHRDRIVKRWRSLYRNFEATLRRS